MMKRPWLGVRNVVFVPVINTSVDPGPPDGFADRIFARLFFDFDSGTGVDRSLQRYISAISHGAAGIRCTITDVVITNNADTMGAARRSIPADNDFDVVVAVLPSGGPDRDGWAWMNQPPISGIADFARVNLNEGLGTWAMEVTHCLTDFPDLYKFPPHLQSFDNMACSCGTHPSVYTKQQLGWLEASTIHIKTSRAEQQFSLHANGLNQPPPPGRVMAVRVPAPSGDDYYMVEARLPTDSYERNSYASSGIDSEGVIVYEVEEKGKVLLRTPKALTVGEETILTGLRVRVTGPRLGGFRIAVSIPLGTDQRLVPMVVGLRPTAAITRIKDADLSPKLSGPSGANSFVASQTPRGGAVAQIGSTVNLRTREGPIP